MVTDSGRLASVTMGYESSGQLDGSVVHIVRTLNARTGWLLIDVIYEYVDGEGC
jgi:hypothetical protein